MVETLSQINLSTITVATMEKMVGWLVGWLVLWHVNLCR